MKYSLKITQISDGETQVAEEPASGGFKGGALELRYIFDGAEYILTLKEDEITHLRTGGVKIEMRFARGQTTSCRIAGGGFDGRLNIVTEKLRVVFGGDGAFAECEFRYEGEISATRLTIEANALQ